MSNKRQIEKGKWLQNICLAPFTSWRIGGYAQRLYWPTSLDDLAHFLKQCPQNESITWLGLGSNVLIRDHGIAGTVIITQGSLKDLSRQNKHTVYAQAGLSCAQVARFAAKNDLVGSAFLAGIPGTIGGALMMNAGAFGGETWPRVTLVELINRQGTIINKPARDFVASYRSLNGLPKDHWFVSATFEFEPGDGAASFAEIKALLTKRAQTQPTGEPSCGSVFRNPEGDYAARLIESVGLKGKKIGDAQISTKHANFIINLGNACAADVEALIELIEHSVKTAYGITLQREVRILGRQDP